MPMILRRLEHFRALAEPAAETVVSVVVPVPPVADEVPAAPVPVVAVEVPPVTG